MAAEQHDPAVSSHALAVGVEPEGVDTAPLIRAAVIMGLMVTVAVVVLFSWSNLEFMAARQAAAQESGYPALRENEAAAAGKLSRFEVLDAGAGVYRIPIDRAVTLVVDEAYRRTGQVYAPELQALAPRN